MRGVVCTTPPPPTACTMPSALTSHTTASTMSSDLTSHTSTGTHVVWRYEHSMPPWPDSESGIEDSPDSVDGGMMPLSPPIPIPSPRRSSLQPSRPCVSSPTEAEPQQRRTSASAPATASHEDETPSPPPPPSPLLATSTPPAAPEPPEEGAAEGGHGVPTIQISEDAGPGDTGVDESSVPPVPKNGGGDSETSELVGSDIPQLVNATSSPTKSPHTHSPLISQQNDGIPTDMSDTTESEPDSKITCLSSGESAVCPNLSSHHQGREITNTVYALPVDTVFTLLFTNSKFMFDLYSARKTSDVVASPWQSNPETNQKLRQVTYTLTLPPNSFGPKVSHVTETQVVSPFSKHGEIYTVDAEACNAGIPYADSFFVSNHWCLTRESATETRLSVWSQVKYKKNMWGFMKGVIDKNAFSGVESLLNDISAALQAEVDSTNLKRTKRRRRRVGSKGEPPDVLQSQVYPDKVKDIHKSTQIPARKLTLPAVTPDSSVSSNEGPVRLVAATLVILLTLNALLYYKLWALEEKMVLRAPTYPTLDPSMFRSGATGGPLEEWVRILQQQEALHAAEVERWRKSIEEAAGFLRKAEESLRTLHTSIPPHHASKLQLLLRQIQSLHEAESQRRSPSEPVHWNQEGSPAEPAKGPDIGEQSSDSSYQYAHENGNHVEL